MARKSALALALVAGLGLAGCAGTDSDTVKRTGGGAALGAAAGTLIGGVTGNWGAGAAIGAVTGATGGFLYDQIKKDN